MEICICIWKFLLALLAKSSSMTSTVWCTHASIYYVHSTKCMFESIDFKMNDLLSSHIHILNTKVYHIFHFSAFYGMWWNDKREKKKQFNKLVCKPILPKVFPIYYLSMRPQRVPISPWKKKSLKKCTLYNDKIMISLSMFLLHLSFITSDSGYSGHRVNEEKKTYHQTKQTKNVEICLCERKSAKKKKKNCYVW